MKYLLLIILIYGTSPNQAQEISNTTPNKLGFRLSKELLGSGLSGMIEVPISKNGKWTLTNSLGITLQHPYYDLFIGRDRDLYDPDWKNTERPKFIDFNLNYPLGFIYYMHIKRYANTHKKWSSIIGFGSYLHLVEISNGMDADNFYTKDGWGLLYGWPINILFGAVYRPTPKLEISLDVFGTITSGVSYQDKKWRKGEGIIPWASAGINVLWNWK